MTVIPVCRNKNVTLMEFHVSISEVYYEPVLLEV